MIPSQKKRSRRGGPRVSLRTLIILFTVISIPIGLFARRLHVQREQTRAVEALRQIGSQWLGSIHVDYEDPHALSEYHWLRGRFPRVVHLDMRNTDAQPKTYAHHIAKLPFLRRLYLGDCVMSDAEVRIISNCRDLQRLELKDNPAITDLSTPSLMRLQKLTALNVRGTGMKWKSIVKLMSHPEMDALSFDHLMSNRDLAELAKSGKLGCPELTCQGINADGLRNLIGLKNAENSWCLNVHKSRVTADWQPVLQAMKFHQVNFIGCTFEPGLFSEYHLTNPGGDFPQRMRITSSYHEFQDVVSQITAAEDLQIMFRDREDAAIRFTVINPTQVAEVGQVVVFEVESPGQSWKTLPASALESLASIKHVDQQIRCDAPELLHQLHPEAIRSAENLLLYARFPPTEEKSYIARLDAVSADQPLENTRKLTLVSPVVTDDDLRIVSRMPNLESLTIGSQRLRGPGLVHLSNLKNLKSIRFGYDCIRIADLKPDQLAEYLGNLKGLETVKCPNTWNKAQREAFYSLLDLKAKDEGGSD